MRTLTHLAAVGLVLLIFGGCMMFCVWPLQPDRAVASFELGDGFTLQIWTHDDWFDIDSRCPLVYYCVFHGSTKVFHPTYLGQDRGQRFDFSIAFSKDRQFACVFSEQGIRHVHD